MERIVVDHEHVVGEDYSGLSLDGFSAQGATFEACRFDRITMGNASLGGGPELSRYLRCSFDRAILTLLGGFARFENCTFRNARFIRPNPNYLEFVDCSFAGEITGLELRGAPQQTHQRYDASLRSFARQGKPEPAGFRELALRDINEIRGNDFSGAELIKLGFRFGVDLGAQKLPVGDDYLYLPDAETTVRQAVAALAADSSAEGGKAKHFLEDVLQREIDYGQRQLLVRPKNFERHKVIPSHILLAVERLRRSR